MDTAVNEALRALKGGNLRRYTELQCPKARRRRLKAVPRLVQVLLGDPNIVCGTNTKGEVKPTQLVLRSGGASDKKPCRGCMATHMQCGGTTLVCRRRPTLFC